MKRILFFIVLFPALLTALVSCETKAVSTPELYVAQLMFRTSEDGVQDTIRITDTLSIGDKLRLNIFIDGRLNTLNSFVASCDTSAMQLALEVDSIGLRYLATGSDMTNGKLVFKPGLLSACNMWMLFSPRKSGTQKIEMTIDSDAGTEFSPRTWTYTTTVR